MDFGGYVVKFLTFLFIFGSVIFLSVVTTRYIGAKAGKSMRGKFISIVESVNLGMDKQIHLVKAGDQFILIASAGKSITFLTALKDNSIEVEESETDENIFDFKNVFDKYIQVFKGNGANSFSKEENTETEEQPKGDIFKNNLDKLKSYTTMINIQAGQDRDDYTNDKS